MFECMGHSKFSGQFRRIAGRVGTKEIIGIVEANPGVPAHVCAQAAYLKLSGLMDDRGANGDVEYVSQLMGVKLGDLAKVFSTQDWPLAGCRPANYPQRRMAAFSHFAQRDLGLGAENIAEFFKNTLASIPSGANTAEMQTPIKNLIENFTGVSDPFWDSHYSVSAPMRRPIKLIGKDKAIALNTDCIIPFFLAECRMNGDAAMEHKLVMIYRSLPAPAANSITDYMTRNMLGNENRAMAKPLRRQQALLQLYKDFCHRAPAGCNDCAFVEYLKLL
jgi:hypothetical protein